jgi:hypothetical protein
MQNPGENLQTVDNAWTGSRKIRARINNVDSIVLRRWKRIESWKFPQQLAITPGTIDIISAKGQYDDLRPRFQHGFPFDLDRRLMLST